MDEKYQQNVGILCAWVETHLDRFVPALTGDTPSFEEIKPLGELALLLFGLTSPRHRGTVCAFITWAERIGHVLWPEVKLVGDQLFGKRRPNFLGSGACAMLLLFPVLEAITSRRFPFHETVSEMLTAAAQQRQHNRDLAFACDVAGIQDCQEDAMADLAILMAVWESKSSLITSSWHYNVTHAIFYATQLGRRGVSWNAAVRIWLHTHLGSFATHRLALKDYDLAAELLASLAWANLEPPISFWTGLDALTEVIEMEGSVPAHPRLFRREGDTFQNHYHATLVSLSALAEGASLCIKKKTNLARN